MQNKILDLDELLSAKEPIYVMNKSKPRGSVTVTIFRPNGSPAIIVVPKTWIPVCITEQCAHETIRGSDDFRRNLAKGMIQLMPKKEAQEILSSPDAQEEKKRINLSKYGSYGTDVTKPEPSPINQFADAVEELDNVKISVKEILQREVSTKEKYHLLRAEEDELTSDDYKYITVNGEGKVKEWAQNHLA